jgi:hypothetical protein
MEQALVCLPGPRRLLGSNQVTNMAKSERKPVHVNSLDGRDSAIEIALLISKF